MSGASQAPRTVPWRDHAEWLRVMHGFFGKLEGNVEEEETEEGNNEENACVGKEEMKWALEQVEVWLLRGNVPPAIETTAHLLRLKFGPTEENDAAVWRLAMAAAIIRLVNEVADPYQQGAYAMPVAQLAERVGLPRMLVELRHEGTHDHLPSSSVLLLAADVALSWLYENYWRPQACYEQSVMETTFAMLERFEAAAKETNGGGPLEWVAGRHLNTISHVEYSPQIQRAFLEALLVSSKPWSLIQPLITALGSRDQRLCMVVLDFCLDPVVSFQEELEKQLQMILTQAAKYISDPGLLLAAIRRCLEAPRGIEYGTILLQHHKATTIPQDLQNTLNILFTSPKRPKGEIPTANSLLAMSQSLFTRLAAESHSPIPEDWFLLSEWKTTPLGLTPKRLSYI